MIRILEFLVAIAMVTALAMEAGPATAIFGAMTFIYFYITATVLRAVLEMTLNNYKKLNSEQKNAKVPTNSI